MPHGIDHQADHAQLAGAGLVADDADDHAIDACDQGRDGALALGADRRCRRTIDSPQDLGGTCGHRRDRGGLVVARRPDDHFFDSTGMPWSSLTSSSSPSLHDPEIVLLSLESMPLIVPAAIDVVVCAPTL